MFAFPLAGQKAPLRSSKPAIVDYPAGPAFSVENVIELVTSVKRNILTEERLMMGLRKRGVDFRPTPEVLSRLVESGASDAVIGVVWKLAVAAPPPPPPPPPPKPTSALAIQCHPAECEVRANDGPFQKTKDGRLLVEGLDPGPVILNFRKDGFDPSTEVVDVPGQNTGVPPSHEVSLHPTEETQRQRGEELAAALRKAASPNPALRALTGNVKVSGDAAASFDVVIHFEPAGVANVELQAQAGHAVIVCHSARCLPSAKSFFGRQKAELTRAGKQLKAEDAEGYVPAVEVLLLYEFDEMFSRLLDPQSIAASSLPLSGDAAPEVLRIANGDNAYLIELDGNSRPAGLRTELTGAGPVGIRAAYRDYKKIGDQDYPSTTELKFGDDKQTILFQAHAITFNTPAPAQVNGLKPIAPQVRREAGKPRSVPAGRLFPESP